MSDVTRKKRTFKKFSFRGKDLEGLLQLSQEEVMNLLCARARRKYRRGQSAAELRYLKKLRKAKANAVVIDDVLQKPSAVKTHMRNMTIVPEMVGCVCKVYSGCHYVTVEIKPAMIGMYLGEFSITYKPVSHGRPGIGATNSSRFIPLK